MLIVVVVDYFKLKVFKQHQTHALFVLIYVYLCFLSNWSILRCLF